MRVIGERPRGVLTLRDPGGSDDPAPVSHRLAATLAAVWAERTGDASSLARFAATGEITEALLARLARDLELLEAAVTEAGFAAESEEWSTQAIVRLLLQYVTSAGVRRPYVGWQRLRDDRHIAVLFRQPPTRGDDPPMDPDASTRPPAQEVNLYEALGHVTNLQPVEAVTVAVRSLYERLFSDPLLLPAFRPPRASVDFTSREARPRLEAHMRAFLTAALGGPERYGGRGMAEAHVRLGVTDEQFTRVIEHAVHTLAALHVPADAIGAVGAKLAPLRPLIVTA
jgi:hemoglobin